MTSAIETLSAIHDWNLRQVLQDLTLLTPIEQGNARCQSCGSILSLDTVGGILVLEGHKYALVCDSPDCLEKAAAGARR